jgi:glucodextranase-like protein
MLLAVAVVALGAAVLLVATGGLGKVATAIGTTFNGFLSDITSTPAPSASEASIADSPVLEAPSEPYTNQKSIDLVGTVPDSIAGDAEYQVRIYVGVGEGQPAPILDVPVGPSRNFLVPDVALTEGTNTFQATVVGPDDRESERSAVVTYILDTSKPRITVSSPKNNGLVNAKTVQIVGQTQGRSAISARNVTTNTTATGSADGAGAFSIVVALGTGTNTIQLTSTDPAGNVNTAKLTVRHGTGALTARVAASVYAIKVSRLPEPVTLTVVVTDPDGRPLAGASVTFTLAVPGVPAIASSELTTSTTGRASFTTTIPKGATKGQASITAIVSSKTAGDTTDRTVINLQ